MVTLVMVNTVHDFVLVSGEIRVDTGGELTYAAVAVEGPRLVG